MAGKTHVSGFNQSSKGGRANMPSNNVSDQSVSLGNHKGSKIAKSPHTKGGVTGISQGSTGGKTALPTHNTPSTKVTLGNTHHGVGEVPGYLRGK